MGSGGVPWEAAEARDGQTASRRDSSMIEEARRLVRCLYEVVNAQPKAWTFAPTTSFVFVALPPCSSKMVISFGPVVSIHGRGRR